MRVPMEYTHFGWKYLQLNNLGQLHPGWDLNFGAPYDDLGMPVYAMTSGVVVHAKYEGTGWGNLMVIEHKIEGQEPMWTRYGHLQSMNYKKGDIVADNEVIGKCGGTGGVVPHLHWDLIIKKLPSWTKYTTGMGTNEVKEYYEDGIKFVEEYYEDEKKSIEKAMKLNSANWRRLDRLDGYPDYIKEAQKHLNLSNEALRKIP
jgi:murein DD-endopeptidase MepM/ murein hydrolase activator NlpD